MAMASPTCFAAGTFIYTETGEIAIEFLKVGNKVLTTEGLLKPIKWIGQRKVDFNALSEHGRFVNRPVLISTSAFGKSLPNQDLVISGTHGIFVNKVLTPVNNLVNGETVRAMDEVQTITYYHLEFDDFEIIVANGIFAESFVDVGNRIHFDNYKEWLLTCNEQQILVAA